MSRKIGHLSLDFTPTLPPGEAAIHFDEHGKAHLYWGGEDTEENRRVWSAGNITAAYAYIKLTQGQEEANSFMRSVGGTGQEVQH